MMPVITLLSDFGTEDEYIGIMKGVILSINPSVSIVDITHHIAPQNLTRAAYIIKHSYSYFPPGTIHLVIVDPGVGSDRAIVALKRKGHIFIAPDNGVLTLIIEEGALSDITRIDNEDYYLKPVSRTFHGRDIFAPVAAYLSSGVDLNKLGPAKDEKELTRLPISRPHISENGELVGKIVCADRFGNLFTDIGSDDLNQFCAPDIRDNVIIKYGNNEIIGISDSYMRVGPKEPLAVIGSRGHLELSINMGNAQLLFNAHDGDPVRIVLPG